VKHRMTRHCLMKSALADFIGGSEETSPWIGLRETFGCGQRPALGILLRLWNIWLWDDTTTLGSMSTHILGDAQDMRSSLLTSA
jgi:hypothetical protein